jgi:hypothetical protein
MPSLTTDVNSQMPCHTMPMRRCAVALRSLFQNGMVMAWHGRGMACVNQTRPHCVKQMGKTQSKTLSGTAWQGNGMSTAWEQHGMCELALTPSAHGRFFAVAVKVSTNGERNATFSHFPHYMVQTVRATQARDVCSVTCFATIPLQKFECFLTSI